MRIVIGALCIVAGALAVLAAYTGRVGLFGWGSPEAWERKRTLTRGRLFVTGPLLVAVGVVVLVDPLAG